MRLQSQLERGERRRAQAFRWWTPIVVGVLVITACAGEETVSSDPSGVKAPSPAVSFPPPEGAGGLQETKIEVEGVERTYGLYAPDPAPSRAAPLVVLLHGPDNDIASTLTFSGLAPLADEHGFLIVLPQTSRKTGVDAQWAVAHGRRENEAETDALSGLGFDSFAAANWPFGDTDANFIMSVVKAVAASHELDETMVFAAGLQNGGLMAARMICDHPDRFAALGGIAFGPFMVQGCSDARPVASFSVLSDRQRTYPLPLGQGHAADLAEHNGCDSEPRSRQLAPDVAELAYGGCEADGNVVLHVVSGVGFPWPWPPNVSSVRFGDYWPAQALWEFLSSHPRP
jgi:polyhydroxybutyrate depolymerase